MAEVMNSLFGITPEFLMADRQAKLQAQAMQYAQADPFQRATASIYQGANQLGGAIGGMLGGQDPELQRVTQRQSLLQQAQPTNAKGWSDLGSQLMQMGDIRGAQEAYAKSQALTKAAGDAAKTQSEIDKNASEVTKNLRVPTPTDARTNEEKNAAVYALTKGQVGSKEYKDAFSDKFVELTTKEGSKPTKVGVTTDSSQKAVYSDGKTQFVFGNDPVTNTLVKVPYAGGVSQLTSKTEVNVDAKGEAEFVKELGKIDAKKVGDAGTVRDTAIASINSLNKLASLPAQDLISGQFAEGRVGATNLLATLGLASPSDVNKLATSQQYQKVAGDVVLQTLGGKLGSGFSNADREFIAGLVPQLETNPEARRKLIQFMQSKNQDIVKEANNLEAYARKNKGLSGYTPTIPMSVAPTSQYSGLSDAELAARIQRAKEAQPK
jgi:hypothetical protein